MNTNTIISERYDGPYLKRSGEGARDLVEVLSQSPELPLTPEQKEEAYAFERSLAEYPLDQDVTIESMIRAQKEESTTAPFFFAASFLDGSIDLSHLGAPVFSSATDVYVWVATAIRDKSVEPAVLAAMAKQSTGIYKQRAEAALLAERDLDEDQLDTMSLVLRPEVIIAHSAQASNARRHLLDMRQVYKEGGERLNGAKRALTDVYLARVNEVITKDIPSIDYFVQQSRLIGDEEGERAALSVIQPALRTSLGDPTVRPRLFTRLDYVRNGIGLTDDRRSTAVSHDLIANEALTQEEPTEAVFRPNEVKILKRTMLTPEQMQDVFTNVLRQAHKLSAEDPSTWSPERSTRAHDGLFQVVIGRSKSTFSVDGVSGAYSVASQPRSLYDALVIGGFHELTHIDQAEADKALGDTLRIASFKGKRVSMLREVGANANQRSAERMFFGKAKPIALTYAKAQQTLEQGGDLFSATRSFYEESRRTALDSSPKALAEVAADRVTRLIRQGGHNSQSMVYAEEVILNKELEGASEQTKERAMLITGLDLVDQARLHKYDLLPSLTPTPTNWTELIVKALDPYITQALQEAE